MCSLVLSCDSTAGGVVHNALLAVHIIMSRNELAMDTANAPWLRCKTTVLWWEVFLPNKNILLTEPEVYLPQLLMRLICVLMALLETQHRECPSCLQ